MVEVGQLSIGASINTQDVESGLTRIRQGFVNVQAKTTGLNSDFERMRRSTRDLAGSFLLIGTVGTGAILALTASSPALASSMAKIKVSVGELARNLGTALQPMMERFSGVIQNIADFVEEHPDLTGKITTSVVGLGIALAAFKVGGAIATGAGTLLSILGGISAVITAPVFLAALAAVVTAAGVLGFARQQAAEAAAYEALVPPGMKDVEYNLEGRQSGAFPSGTRQFVPDIESTLYAVNTYNQNISRMNVGMVLKDQT